MKIKNSLKKTETAVISLKKAKQRYKVFFKTFYSSPIAKAIIDLKTGRYFEINSGFLKLFACARKDVIGRTPKELGFVLNNNETKKILNKYKKNKYSTFNFDIQTKSKKIKNVIITTEKIELFDEDYLIGHIIDNSDKAEFEKKLKESEHKYGLVLQNTPNAIYEFNFKKTEYTYISPSVKSILGISPDVFTKKRFNIITPLLNSKYRKKIREHYKLMKFSTGKQKKNFSFEYPFTLKNNEIWISDNQTVIYDKNGKAEKVIGNISDITLKKTNEFLLSKSEEQYKYLFNKNPMPMWIFDFDTLRILSVNDAAVKHYGYSHEEFRRFKITDLRPNEEVERFLKYTNEVILRFDYH